MNTSTTLSRLVGAALLAAAVACTDNTVPDAPGTCVAKQITPQNVADNTPTTVRFNDITGCPQALGDSVVLTAGVWTVQAQVSWEPNALGKRGLCLFVDGVAMSEAGDTPLAGNVMTVQSVSATIVSAGHTVVWITGTQTSGATIATMPVRPTNLLTFASATRLSK